MKKELLQKPAILLLENGTFFEGYACGKIGTTIGELSYANNITGYQEVFTDASLYGKLLVMTNTHLGNYGVKDTESESDKVQIAGLVCKDFSENYSRDQADGDLQSFLDDSSTVGITRIDTRQLVKIIREKGSMKAIISSDNLDVQSLKTRLQLRDQSEELVSKVTAQEPYDYGKEDAKNKVAVIDLGVNKTLLDNLVAYNCVVKVFPATTSYEDIKAYSPDGILISNGPGDPATQDQVTKVVANIIEDDLPLFGIGLGYLLMARALGLGTFKTKKCHRVSNLPVLNLQSNKSEMAKRTYGYAIVAQDLSSSSSKITQTHKNLHDNLIEGFKVNGKKAFGVHYIPFTGDSQYLFEQFVELM